METSDLATLLASVLQDMPGILPELALTATLLLVLLADLVAGRGRALTGDHAAGRLPGLMAVLGLLVSAGLAYAQLGDAPRVLFQGMLTADSLAAFFKLIFALSTALIVLASFRIRHQGELLSLLLAAVLGMDFLAGARNLLMIAVSLELVSIMSYVLAGFDRNDPRSGEAALKYMVFGSMASGALLFGASWLFGLTGSLDLAAIQVALSNDSADPLVLMLATLLVLAGIGYKIAMVPVHFWCPDVYDGAPTPITTFFSVGPKAAGIALLMRFLYPTFTLPGPLAVNLETTAFHPAILVANLAAFTMTLGNLAAIGQTRVKRLLAYSSIAHAGYLMTGLVLATPAGLSAVLFYVVIYLFMNYGAFLLVDAIGQMRGGEDLAAFRGLGKRHPALAVAMTVFLVSLVGLPPVAGFIGKFVLFGEVIRERWYWLATVAVLNSVVSLYYYFSVAKSMWFDEGDDVVERAPLPAIHAGIIAGLCALTLVLGLWWQPLVDLTARSIAHLI
jgi:NADH-quinone oxidoreductase subunit N